MASCLREPSCARHTEGRTRSRNTRRFRPLSAQTCDRSPMTVRGGGVPVRCMASNAVPQNGSAASELAADAYPCIMVWVFVPPHTRMWHESSCTCPQLPSTSSSRSQQVCRRARSPQGQACRWPPDGRPSLDRSCARRRQNLAVGARESLRRGRTREIRIGQQRKLCRGRAKQLRDEKNGKAPSCTPLTKKAPYKQRSNNPPDIYS